MYHQWYMSNTAETGAAIPGNTYYKTPEQPLLFSHPINAKQVDLWQVLVRCHCHNVIPKDCFLTSQSSA